MAILIVIIFAFGAYMFFKLMDAIANWGNNRTVSDARLGRAVRNFFVVLIAVVLIVLFAAANS